MLIACKCLNVILNSANNLPSSLSIPNDNDCNQQSEYNLPAIHLQPVQLQQCTINKIKRDHLQFFKSVSEFNYFIFFIYFMLYVVFGINLSLPSNW